MMPRIAALVGVLASTPPSTTKRERSSPSAPAQLATSAMSGQSAARGSSSCAGGAPTGTKVGSKATGKLDDARAAKAICAAVAAIRP